MQPLRPAERGWVRGSGPLRTELGCRLFFSALALLLALFALALALQRTLNAEEQKNPQESAPEVLSRGADARALAQSLLEAGSPDRTVHK